MTAAGTEQSVMNHHPLMWIDRWRLDLKKIDTKDAQHDYLKRVYSMAASMHFRPAVELLLWMRLQKNVLNEKAHLESLAADASYMQEASKESLALLCASYHHSLELYVQDVVVSHKPIERHEILGQKEVETVTAFLKHLDYGDVLKRKAATQSTAIARVADVMQFDAKVGAHNWFDCPADMREDYLTKLSLATDYVLTQVKYGKDADGTIYNHTHKPKDSRVSLVCFDKELKRGEYVFKTDRIGIYEQSGFVDSVKTLQHEKTHQLSEIDYHRHVHDAVYDAQYRMQLYQPAMVNLFQEFADDQLAYHVYLAQPDEKLARFCEDFCSPDTLALDTRKRYGDQLQIIFNDAPAAFSYMKEALTKFDQYLAQARMSPCLPSCPPPCSPPCPPKSGI